MIFIKILKTSVSKFKRGDNRINWQYNFKRTIIKNTFEGRI